MWARVSNNTVRSVIDILPKTFQGVSNFDTLPNTTLAQYGWLPYTQTIPTFNASTHYVKSVGYTITPTSVTEVFDVFIKLPLTTVTKSPLISKLEFRSLFTITELITIEVTKLTHADPSVRATLNVISDNLQVADAIDLTDPRTALGLNTLVAFGLLTDLRVATILAG